MDLYYKLIDKIPIKTVGIWMNESWNIHNLMPALEGIGNTYYIPVPVEYNGYVTNKKAFSTKVLDCVKEINPDLLFCHIQNKWIVSEPFLEIKKMGIPSINISLNDSYQFNFVSDIAHAFSLNMTTYKYAMIKYARNNAQAIYLPEGLNPNMYYLKATKTKDIDVCFIGNYNKNNATIIQAIKDAGINIVVRGENWSEDTVSFEEKVDLYSRSKIVLGFSRTQNSNYAIKGQDFEVLMCGAFYLCEYNPELCDWLHPHRELVFWDNIRDLIPKIKYYLKYDKQRTTIACMGHFKVATEHTWMDRFETMFRYINEKIR